MARFLKVPETIAEYTLGTIIVLIHVGVLQPLEKRAMEQREAEKLAASNRDIRRSELERTHLN